MSTSFRQRALEALQNQRLRRAVRISVSEAGAARDRAIAQLTELAREGLVPGDFEAMRQRARAIKDEAITNLDRYLEQSAEAIRSRGGQVYFAREAAEVGAIVREIAARREVSLAVKGKSMATEEVGLNSALEAAGVEVVETDLGEYIIQLAGEKPSHIVAPAIHKSREEIAALFSRVVGQELATDTPTLAGVARRVLRKKFMQAGMGISGANFVVAETGTICLVTNEGNGRLVTSAPPVHVAVAGIEKLVPSLDDLGVLLSLLARSSTGQKLSVYTHLVTGPRRRGEADGPEELHVIFLDAGRSAIRGTEHQEVLHCIRCGACLDHCPVYRNLGGHAYGGVYSGPIGTVLTPLLSDFAQFKDLPAEACTLCGACDEVCPTGIRLSHLILAHRRRAVEQGLDKSGLSAPLKLGAAVWTRPWAYRLSLRLARTAVRANPALLPRPLQAWREGREFPAPAPQSFREMWEGEQRRRTEARAGAATGAPAAAAQALGRGHTKPPATSPKAFNHNALEHSVLVERFLAEFHRLGGKGLLAGSSDEALEYLASVVGRQGPALLWDDPLLSALGAGPFLAGRGAEVTLWTPELGDLNLKSLAEGSQVGITTAVWAVAETGSIVLPTGPGQGRLVSLLPRTHIALIPEDRVLASVAELFRTLSEKVRSAESAGLPSSLALATGPSRSADIENDLTVGVHGPAEVHVVLLPA